MEEDVGELTVSVGTGTVGRTSVCGSEFSNLRMKTANVNIAQHKHTCKYLICGNDTWKQYIEAIRGNNNTWKQYVETLHGNNMWRQYVETIRGNNTWIQYVETSVAPIIRLAIGYRPIIGVVMHIGISSASPYRYIF